MNFNVFGEPIPVEDTKTCNVCGVDKHISCFEVNRKFFDSSSPHNYYESRRPTCKQCRLPKKGLPSSIKNKYTRPETLICPICGETVDGKFAVLDHVHGTNIVRGYICNNCNTAIGKLKESPIIIEKALTWVINDGPIQGNITFDFED